MKIKLEIDDTLLIKRNEDGTINLDFKNNDIMNILQNCVLNTLIEHHQNDIEEYHFKAEMD